MSSCGTSSSLLQRCRGWPRASSTAAAAMAPQAQALPVWLLSEPCAIGRGHGTPLGPFEIETTRWQASRVCSKGPRASAREISEVAVRA